MDEGWIMSEGERKHTEIDQAGRVGARLEGVGAGDAHGVGAVLDGHKGAVALGVEVAVDGGHEVAVGFGGVAPMGERRECYYQILWFLAQSHEIAKGETYWFRSRTVMAVISRPGQLAIRKLPWVIHCMQGASGP